MKCRVLSHVDFRGYVIEGRFSSCLPWQQQDMLSATTALLLLKAYSVVAALDTHSLSNGDSGVAFAKAL